MTISLVIMQMALSVVAMYVTASSSNFIFLSLPFFHKIDQKTFKGITSSLYFTTLVNIFPKLRYFVDRIYTQIS